MVKLESVTKRWIALSTDAKPTDDVPAGSSLLESDTGKVFRWNGYEWQCPPANLEAIELQQAILLELAQIRELLQITV